MIKTFQPKVGVRITAAKTVKKQRASNRLNVFKQGAVKGLQYAIVGSKTARKLQVQRTNLGTVRSTNTINDFINNYYARAFTAGADVAKEVSYIYSKSSKVMKGTAEMLAVRMRSGERGWITAEGRFIAEKDMADVFRSIDETVVGSGSDYPLSVLWEKLTPKQKAEVAAALRGKDWEEFFRELYPGMNANARRKSKGTNTVSDYQFAAFDDLIVQIGTALGMGA